MTSSDYSDIHIETTLPKPWEEEQSFNDVLYDWMSRAPWLAISAAAHLLVFFILMAIPWEWLNKDEGTEIQASIETPPEELFEEEEEEPEEIVEEEIIEEPVLQDAEIEETTEEVFEDTEQSTEDFSTPFDSDAFNDVIGIGGGAGSKFGKRFGKKRGAKGGKATEEAVRNGLEWLKTHQDPAGYWDADGFSSMCGGIGTGTCDGEGESFWDVGLTGLALLAFMGDGNTTDSGVYKDVVKRGIAWIVEQRDPDTGLLGDRSAPEFIYNHTLGTLALCESYYFVKSPRIKRVAQDAVDYLQHRARNPYGAWRYDVPPNGENDTSITGWGVFALASAKDAGLDVDEEALNGALDWIDEVTDKGNGRVGYVERGSRSARTLANQHYPDDRGEAMTAVGMLARMFVAYGRGEDIASDPVIRKQADLLKSKTPEWDPDGLGVDMYYWYYGSYAMFQMGGSHWKAWKDSMETAVLGSQRDDADQKGSWDPIGPWGYSGGRVYSTSLMVLCLEVYYRYAKIFGAR